MWTAISRQSYKNILNDLLVKNVKKIKFFLDPLSKPEPAVQSKAGQVYILWKVFLKYQMLFDIYNDIKHPTNLGKVRWKY